METVPVCNLKPDPLGITVGSGEVPGRKAFDRRLVTVMIIIRIIQVMTTKGNYLKVIQKIPM
jgi:hypothetical protein